MEKDLLLALIAGFFGVTGGAIAWIQAIKTARIKKDTDILLESIKTEATISLEKLKISNEKKKKAFELASKESKPIEDVLSKAWNDIQTIKDLISKMIISSPIDYNIFLEKFGKAHDSLMDNYAQFGSIIPDDVRKAWHKAKNNSEIVKRIIEENIPSCNARIVLNSETREDMLEIRNSFTDQQMVISNVRQKNRDKMITYFMDIL